MQGAPVSTDEATRNRLNINVAIQVSRCVRGDVERVSLTIG